jgi:hypothetical protein
MEQGTLGSMKKLGVTESYKLKRQVVLSASEAAEMIIRFEFRLALHYVTILTKRLAWTIFYELHQGSAKQFSARVVRLFTVEYITGYLRFE